MSGPIRRALNMVARAITVKDTDPAHYHDIERNIYTLWGRGSHGGKPLTESQKWKWRAWLTRRTQGG